MVGICQIGAGRIGAVHAANIAAHPEARLTWIVDTDRGAAEAIGRRHGARVTTDVEVALSDSDVDGVVIASPTDTHVDFILAAVRAGKPVFCEKPIDLDLARVDDCLEEVRRQQNVPIQVGFNRRFDPSFSSLHRAVQEGVVGKVELVKITSRDPVPPPISYIQVSGGLFRDMMIHDFDMARWLMEEEPVEVFAFAAVLVSKKIGKAGDVDTAAVTMRGESGTICQIDNSRRAAYGYDQRIEVFGERGMLQAGNPVSTTVTRWTEQGVSQDKPPHFFIERYAKAYQLELDHFVQIVRGKAVPSVGLLDGRQALALADAAFQSLQDGCAVRVN